MKKIAVLGIDYQHDFCKPGLNLLFVPGADADVVRFAQFINKNAAKIDYIALTQDSHQVIDISHPAFWKDKNGAHPAPFTQITAAQAQAGDWVPQYMPKQAIKYLQDLEAQKEFPHLIWPEHCIVGSYGAAIDSNLMDVAIIPWARNGKFYQIVQKGQYPLAEHFGAFRANVEVVNQPSTQVNQPLINVLSNYDEIYFSGEAKTHCVANTLKQALDYPTLAAKFIVLTDCMSSVPGYDNLSDPIYADATAKGVRFAKSTDITL